MKICNTVLITPCTGGDTGNGENPGAKAKEHPYARLRDRGDIKIVG